MTVGILLAAGKSTRFGCMKQLATLPSGQTLLAASSQHLRESIQRVLIVISDDAALMAHAAHVGHTHDCEVIINPRASEGMASSIQCAVRTTNNATGWLIALADMPFIKPPSIATIAAALTNATKIIVPTYQGQRGHPVAFGASYADELCQLTGDTGARDIINRHPLNVVLRPLDDAGILRDVDTPAMLQA
jgi:molybdenum cofactor cytidylyltransferase